MLLTAFLAGVDQAHADGTPVPDASPTYVAVEPTVIFQVWPTLTVSGDMPTPASPVDTPTPEPQAATGTPQAMADTPTIASTATSDPGAAETVTQVSVPPVETPIVAPPTSTPEPDSPTPTPTPSASGTATPSPTPTSSWLPPGPECSVKPGKAVLKLDVPYVHQVNDVNNADGNWACGPASVLMVLAYYGKLEPWPQYVAQHGEPVKPVATVRANPPVSSRPTSTTNEEMKLDYAPYLTNVYTNGGHTYSATAPDPRGNLVAGLYGTISPSGLADWGRMKQVLEWSGLTTAYVAPTWNGVVAALKRGHPVLLGNDLTAAGHIMVAIGYTSNNQLIVNDPYGNRFIAGYGINDGDGVYYAWSCSRVRNALEVIGVYTPPSPTPVATATAVAQPQLSATATAGSGSARADGPDVGALSTQPDANFGLHLTTQPSPTANHQGADSEAATSRRIPDVRVLAAQKSTPKPAYWVLIVPTLLGLAAFVIMYIDWRTKRRARSESQQT